MLYTLHHTCSQEGGEETVILDAPYLSEYNPDEGKEPFLGEGFYFWDYNIDQARYWGDIKYKGEYFVLEVDVDIQENTDDYLDLAGNRRDLVDFVALIQMIEEETGLNLTNVEFSKLITYLKEEQGDIFDYQILRVIDYKATKVTEKHIFAEGKKNYTLLNPNIIFLFTQKDKIPEVPETRSIFVP